MPQWAQGLPVAGGVGHADTIGTTITESERIGQVGGAARTRTWNHEGATGLRPAALPIQPPPQKERGGKATRVSQPPHRSCV